LDFENIIKTTLEEAKNSFLREGSVVATQLAQKSAEAREAAGLDILN